MKHRQKESVIKKTSIEYQRKSAGNTEKSITDVNLQKKIRGISRNIINLQTMDNHKSFFAPELFIPNGVHDISFYEKAFRAVELRRFSNEDGSIHVSELRIDGALFHLHETTAKSDYFSPDAHQGTTVCIGLFVPDVDAVMKNAIHAGAEEISPVRDYEYGYRQGTIKDPFGHYWQVQQKI